MEFLPITLDAQTVEILKQENEVIEIDLENQLIKTKTNEIRFEIDAYKKKILLEGLDDIAQTLQFEENISKFELSSKIPSVL